MRPRLLESSRSTKTTTSRSTTTRAVSWGSESCTLCDLFVTLCEHGQYGHG
eukprot:m.226326 g.226326  ORF g.226326 m.226326 type:complete len:51 (-) comp25928_c1_seq10:120-272(-)